MSEPGVKDTEMIEAAPERPALPPPSYYQQAEPYAPPQATGVIDRVFVWVEQKPVATAVVLFCLFTVVHLAFLNLAGVASGIFVGDELFAIAGTTPIEILMLAFVAYNVVLPTLIAHACVRAFDDLRPSFALDDRTFGQVRATLALVDSPSIVARIAFGGLWAVTLATVYGDLLRRAIPGEGASYALLTIWMYVRLALTFGLLGSSITFVALLHHRFRKATGANLRVELFDMRTLQPVATYARQVALYLIVLLALAGPAVAQPDAFYASAILLAVGVLLTGIAVAGAMWGARRSIRSAKKVALTELHTYSRELWRRAYANDRVAEAVAIPALGAMLTVRSEIARISDWPGGWGVLARVAILTLIPIVSWFGGQLAAQLIGALTF